MYRWDAENRLVRGMSYGATDRAGWRRVDWAYDALGRRIRQTSYVLSNGVWVVTEDLKFVSDPVWFGRHLAELNATNHALVRSYVWGLDLSETLDSAGGVGGLLWVRLASGLASGTHFVTYDGNGNVWQLVSACTGTETARYEYGPFGEPLRTTGAAVSLNPFRFSTKRTDPATGLVLYEYRAYWPTGGRWLTPDPIEEKGGLNLYGFIRNDCVNLADEDARSLIAAGLKIAAGLLAVCATDFALCVGHVYDQLHKARKQVRARTGQDPELSGTAADALGHCVASCNLAKAPSWCLLANVALWVTNLHEDEQTAASRMDVLNNFAGNRLGKGKLADCFQACQDALRAGQLVCLDVSGNLTPCKP
ncbi:RHS repeat-associated core domain-containing protein [Limisphaera sp. VF-2]|uniref:RHS repeat-associated core domain-containing protein n=1 Tax=Limisphaera sp. VF-2 TaxID=3400418 RepID=UPI0017728FCA